MGLYARRQTLAEAMTWEADPGLGRPAVKGWPYVPERITPPVALVREGLPYVEDAPADGYGRWLVRHQVDLVAGRGSNEATTKALDAMVTDALAALEDVADTTTEVGEFYTLQANGTAYLAVTITTTTTTTEL